MNSWEANPRVYRICGCVFCAVGIIALSVCWKLFGEIKDGSAKPSPAVYVLGAIGIVAIVLGVTIILLSLRSTGSIDRLIEDNDYVMADITAIPIDHSLTVNGMPTYRVECTYIDPLTRKKYIFRSRNFFVDPAKTITADQVRVYVDREGGYKKYLVDIDSVLPK